MNGKLSRRQLVGLAAALMALTPRQILAATPETIPDESSAFLSLVCDLVIPRTDTGGALDAGVPAFVYKALSVKLSPGVEGLALLPWLQGKLGVNFEKLPAPEKLARLKRFDAAEYKSRTSPWIALKSLIVMAYYTSEIGGEKELQYDLVPGRFDPDLPLKPSDRAYSSDWTAVTYG